MLEGLVVEGGFLDPGEEGLEGGKLHEALDVSEGFETAEGLEVTQCEGDFGLVVGVCELVWVAGVELGGEVFVLGQELANWLLAWGFW